MGFRRLILLLGALGLALPATAHGADLYVALGDSYTAGPLIPNQVGALLPCLRSDRNYPALTAEELVLTLRDVSCSGAGTIHMSTPQDSLPLVASPPPQLDAVTADAGLVTVGIGANDARIVTVALNCAATDVIAPTGSACRGSQASDGGDLVRARIAEAAPKIGAVLRDIHRRAPGARVAIVGYPSLVPNDGTSCYPLVPLSPDDLAYVDELFVALNAVIVEQAAANDAEYVDTYADSIGHDMCAPPQDRWYEGLIPGNVAYSMHPNAQGEAAMARALLAVLSRPRPEPAPVLSAFTQQRAAGRTGPPPRFGFTLDRAATVRLKVRRRVAASRYGPVVGTFARAFGAGPARVVLPRRLVGRRPGARKLTATPVAGERTGATVAVRFRIG